MDDAVDGGGGQGGAKEGVQGRGRWRQGEQVEEETKLAGGGKVAKKGWMRELPDFTIWIFRLTLQLSNKQSACLPSS